MTYYEPSSLVTRIHDSVRFLNGPKSFPTSFTFNSAALTQEGPLRSYLVGIIGYAGVYIAVGIITFIALLITLSCICCCRNRKNADGRPACCNGCRCRPRTFCYAPYYWFVALAALFIVICIGLAEAVNMRDSLTTTVTAITGLADAFINIGTSVTSTNPSSPGLSPALTQVGTSLSGLNSSMVNAGGGYDALAPSVVTMMTSTASAATDINSLGTQITDVGNSFKSTFNGGSLNLDAISKQVFIGSIVPLALFLTYLVIFGVTLSPNKCAALTFRVCNLILLPILFLVFLFSAIFIIVSFFGADVCYSPSTVITTLLNSTAGGDNTAASTLSYYTSCQYPAGVYAPLTSSNSPVLNYLVEGSNTFATTQAQFSNLTISINNNLPYNANVNASLVTTQGSLNTAQTSMNGVLTAAGCAPLNNAYQNLLIALCGSKGVGAMAALWAIGTAGCVFVFLLAVCSIPICLQHPHDYVELDDVAKSSTGVTPNGGNGAGKTYANAAPQPAHAGGGWGAAPVPTAGVQMSTYSAPASGAPSAYV